MGFFGDLLDGFLDLANEGVKQYSEISQCKNFTDGLLNAGLVEGMDEVERNAIMLDVLKSCGAATTPDTLLGEIYPYMEKKANEYAENLSLPTAHETCPAKCSNYRSKCGECLKERLAILEALNYAENPELYRQSYNSAGDFGESTGFVPSSTMAPEQQAYELIYQHQLKALDETNTPEAMKAMINLACASSWSVCPEVPKAEMLRLAEQSVNETFSLLKAKMSLSDLYFIADHYHMSVPTYLRGLFQGDPNLKTAAVLRKEQQEERERELRQQQAERDRQIREEKEAKLKQIQQENHRRQLDMINRRTSGYVGGGGGGGSTHCCGTCVHYMSATNRCTEHTYSPNGASDYCSSYLSK